MIRAEAISLYGFMVLPLIWWGVKALDTKEKVRQTILCGLAGLLLMSPWLVYNNLRFFLLPTQLSYCRFTLTPANMTWQVRNHRRPCADCGPARADPGAPRAAGVGDRGEDHGGAVGVSENGAPAG